MTTSTTLDDFNFNQLMELMHSKETSSYDEIHKFFEDCLIKKYGHAKILDKLKFKREDVSLQRVIDTNEKRRSQDDINGRSADNELVFTLLKDDLTCVTCRGMDVSAGNQLIECTTCHALYHQHCHTPYILDSELNTNWLCSTCKYRNKKLSKHNSSSNSSSSSSSSSNSSTTNSTNNHSSKSNSSSNSKINSLYTKLSSPAKQFSTLTTSSNSSKTSNSSSIVSGGSTKSPSSNSNLTTTLITNVIQQTTASSSASATSTNSRVVVPNINIVSANADKRLQIMKRKAAAKIQEKRKPKT